MARIPNYDAQPTPEDLEYEKRTREHKRIRNLRQLGSRIQRMADSVRDTAGAIEFARDVFNASEKLVSGAKKEIVSGNLSRQELVDLLW